MLKIAFGKQDSAPLDLAYLSVPQISDSYADNLGNRCGFRIAFAKIQYDGLGYQILVVGAILPDKRRQCASDCVSGLVMSNLRLG